MRDVNEMHTFVSPEMCYRCCKDITQGFVMDGGAPYYVRAGFCPECAEIEEKMIEDGKITFR